MSSSSFELVDEMVRAGAGAGKTTTLTKQVLKVAFSHYHQHGKFPSLVVTTFSRKATQELRERLVIEAIKTDHLDFLEYVSSRSRLHISTIHGVLSLFLRRYGHLFQFNAGFQVIAENQAHFLAKDVLRKILLSSSRESEILETWSIQDLLTMLRLYHQSQLQEPDLHLSEEQTLFSLFRRLFQGEGQSLLAKISLALEQNTVLKWKDYLQQLSGLVERLLGVQSLNDWDQFEKNLLLLGRKPPFSNKQEPFSCDLHESIDTQWKNIKNLLQKPGINPTHWTMMWDKSQSFHQLAEKFHLSFSEEKKKRGSLEMNDLELLSLQKIRQYPEMSGIFSQDWDYWLIDEFQDTSPVQVELLTRLMGDRKSFIVGDPQQSIYLFRGARSEIFQKKWQEVGDRGGALTEKRTNFRSTPPLLHFLNDIFHGVGRQFQPMEPKRSKNSCDPHVATFFIVNEEKAELASLSHYLERLKGQGVKFSEICILGRTNQDLEEIARYLQKNNYPIHLHAAGRFYERREVEDGLIVLRFLLNPWDNINLLSLLRSPFFRVEDQELGEWMREKPISLWQNLMTKDCQHPSILKLQSYLEQTGKMGLNEVWRKIIFEEGWMDFSLLYDGTGRREANLWKVLCQLNKTMTAPSSRYLDLSTGPSVNGNDYLIEETDAISALEPNRMQLMTVHAAKGLQFPHVILPRCHIYHQNSSCPPFAFDEETKAWGVSMRDENGDEKFNSLPQWLNQEEQKKREAAEQERLLYVALTRAQQSVMLSWICPFKKGSWASMLERWSKVPGTHKNNFYHYTVEEGPCPIDFHSPQAIDTPVVVDSLHSSLFVSPTFKKAEKDNHQKASGQERKFFLNQKISVSQYLESRFSLPQWQKDKMNHSEGLSSLQNKVQASVKGTTIHRLMELLHYHWDFNFAETLHHWFGSEVDQVQEALHYIRAMKVPPMEKLIREGNVEWGFQVKTCMGILEGQIDLWGKDQEGQYWLVDYKSGSELFLEKAFYQLSLYSHALHRLGVKESIRMAVIFPLSKKEYIRIAPTEKEMRNLFPELFEISGL